MKFALKMGSFLGGIAKSTDSCCWSGCRQDLLDFTCACLPFIQPFHAVCTLQRMQIGLDPSVLPRLYRLEDFTATVYWK